MIKKILIPLCVVLVLALGGIGGFAIYNSQKEPEGPKEADPVKAEELYVETRDTAVEGDAADPYMTQVDFKALRELNPDVYAWIKIPGTNIDYPILQSSGEEIDYYLDWTRDGKYGLPGAIYTQKYNTTGFMDTVTVIYGHNMGKTGTMFTELHKYEEREFFDANPYIYIYLPSGRLKYQIFAAVAFDNRYILGSYNFSDSEDVSKYISELKACFQGNVNDGADIRNPIITLSTCITGSPEQRWLVNAVLVEETRY